jgi:hypothetical protein
MIKSALAVGTNRLLKRRMSSSVLRGFLSHSQDYEQTNQVLDPTYVEQA